MRNGSSLAGSTRLARARAQGAGFGQGQRFPNRAGAWNVGVGYRARVAQ